MFKCSSMMSRIGAGAGFSIDTDVIHSGFVSI